jgi:hypothetical protein
LQLALRVLLSQISKLEGRIVIYKRIEKQFLEKKNLSYYSIIVIIKGLYQFLNRKEENYPFFQG